MDINSQNLPSASVVPGADAVEEFRAITQLAPASENSTSSVNVAIRSGTNAWHGDAFDYLRNNLFDAHPFFEIPIHTPVFQSVPDQLRYNQFGGTVGGPVSKDRTFFFASVQLTRSRTVTQVTGIYPTSQMLQGNFAGTNPLTGAAQRNFGPVTDPQTQAPFPGNQVPASRFSAFASQFLPIAFLPANCPACQASGLGFDFAGRTPAFANSNQYLGRIDHHFSDRDALFGTLEVQPGNATTTPSPNPISAMDTPTHAYLFTVNELHTFSPRLVNEILAGYTRLRATLQQQENAKSAFSFENTPTSIPALFPTVVIVGYTGEFGNGAISDRNFSLEDSWDFRDSVSYFRGQHEFKAGFETIRAHFWNTVNLNAFFEYADGLPASLGFTGVGFADFLTGVPLLGVTFQGTGKASMVERSIYAGYLQDNWRISPKLTVNAGLRYEFPQRWHDSDTQLNRLGTLDTSPASQAAGGRFLLGGSANFYVPGAGVVEGSGAPAVRGAIVDPSWRDFQPRAGLAWRPFASSRTALRAGAGVYFTVQDANSLAFEMLSPPFSYEYALVNLPPAVPMGQPLHDSQFWPASAPSGIAQEGDDPRNRDPRTYEWTASIERQVGNGWLLSAEYLGNHGVKQPYTLLINDPGAPTAGQLAQLLANPALNVPLATVRAPFPNVALSYQYLENIAPSWYEALNLKAEGRLRHGVNLSAVYTWSKAMDLASAEQQVPATVSNLALGKSYSDYDHPQRLVASWVYELPFGRSARRFWRTLAGGWETTGIATFESGAPYTVSMGVDTAFRGGSEPTFPDLIGRPVLDNIRQSGGIYLTPANLAAPPFGHIGDLARNALHGPGVNNFDLGAIKYFAVTERVRLELRGEFFNAFNHGQFEFAGATLASSMSAGPNGVPAIQYIPPEDFGRVAARPPRVTQVALKLIW